MDSQVISPKVKGFSALMITYEFHQQKGLILTIFDEGFEAALNKKLF